MTTIPVTFYVESDNRLGAAFLMLAAAHEYLDEFAREHPERVDDNIQQALANTQTAHSLLDSDFYTERMADPEHEPEGLAPGFADALRSVYPELRGHPPTTEDADEMAPPDPTTTAMTGDDV